MRGKGTHPPEEKAKPGKVAVERYGPTFEEQDTLDPVLGHSLTSFRTKHDINAEIDTSSDTLKLGRNRYQVFHRDTVADQVTVTRKGIGVRGSHYHEQLPQRRSSKNKRRTPWQRCDGIPGHSLSQDRHSTAKRYRGAMRWKIWKIPEDPWLFTKMGLIFRIGSETPVSRQLDFDCR